MSRQCKLGKRSAQPPRFPKGAGRHCGGILQEDIRPCHIFHHHCLKPVVLDGGTQTNSINITWKLDRDAHSQPLTSTDPETRSGVRHLAGDTFPGVLVHTQCESQGSNPAVLPLAACQSEPLGALRHLMLRTSLEIHTYLVPSHQYFLKRTFKGIDGPQRIPRAVELLCDPTTVDMCHQTPIQAQRTTPRVSPNVNLASGWGVTMWPCPCITCNKQLCWGILTVERLRVCATCGSGNYEYVLSNCAMKQKLL